MFRRAINTLPVFPGNAFQLLTRKPAKATATTLFPQSLRALSTTNTSVTPAVVSKILNGFNIFVKERTDNAAEQTSSSGTQFRTRRRKPWADSQTQFHTDWQALPDNEKAAYGERALAGEGVAWPKLYPRESKLTSIRVFMESRRAEMSPQEALEEERAKTLGAEWDALSDGQRAEYLPKTIIVHSPARNVHEMYPKKIRVSGSDSFCKERLADSNNNKTRAELKMEWDKMSEEEMAQYPATSYTEEAPTEAANFERFNRIHFKEFINANLLSYSSSYPTYSRIPVSDEANTLQGFHDTARFFLQRYWTETMTEEQRRVYSCLNR